MTSRPQFPTGSKRWRWDPRERKFEHHRFYGAPNTAILPKEGLKRPLRPIENQRFTLRCGAYSSAVSNGYLRRLRFHPDWQAKKIGQKQKRNVDDYGSEPRAIMNSLRDDGSLFWDFSPIHLETHGMAESGDWNSYPDDLDEKAKSNRITGYLGVEGPHDTFDDIKWALFNAFDPVSGTGAVVHAFSQWYDEWTDAPYGLVGLSYGAVFTDTYAPWWKKAWNSLKRFFGAATGWHTYLFVDWCIIDGIEYLVSPGSYGTSVGNQGFFYFPREVINAEFKKWGTALKIPTGMLTEDMIQEAKKETALGLIIRKFLAFCYILSDAYGRFGTPVASASRDAVITLALQAVKAIQALLKQLPEEKPQPAPIPQPQETMQQMVRRKCNEHGFNLKTTNDIFATIQCESGFNPRAKNENRFADGRVASTDWGICQINDHYHIGPGKSFPSVEYVLNNPEACVDWMCKQWKAGRANWWICYRDGYYKRHL
jgi:hypothetical protein